METNGTFCVNFGLQEAEPVQLSEKNQIPSKKARERYKLSQLLCESEYIDTWNFKNEAVERYRRSMVPFYLLAPESGKFPVYIDNSNINPNFTRDYTIKKLTVNISQSVKA